ncbi:keratin-associated protein 10-4-like [Notechis scutatus]|uniref:Keratin-associated protein 10-4-like n=1 Tax=Notechis scutatus TaxID=8663 RepID=A0A6J1VQY6_9SAUR|nr:keratin-associated protein 10-4-like [Notechis scutatus]
MSYQCKQPCLPPPCLKGATVCVGPGTTVCISPSQSQDIDVCDSPTGAICASQGQSSGQCTKICHEGCGPVVLTPVQTQSFSPCATISVSQNQGQNSTVCVPQPQGCQCAACCGSVAPIQSQGGCAPVCASPVCLSPVAAPLAPAVVLCQDPCCNVCAASKGATKCATKCAAPEPVACMDPCKGVKCVKSCDDTVCAKGCQSANQCNVKKC